MTFEEVLAQVLEALQRRFDLDDAYLDDLKEEIIYVKKLALDEDGRVLVWTGDSEASLRPTSAPASDSGTWLDPLCGAPARARGVAPGLGTGRDWAWPGGRHS